MTFWAKHRFALIICIFSGTLAINLLYTLTYRTYHTTGLFVNIDGFAYILKALEISRGDFAPIATHGFGLSWLLTPILYLLKTESIFMAMVYAQFASAVFGALTVFPLYLLARCFLDEKYSLLAVVLTSSSFWYMFGSFRVLAEPALTFFLILTIYFLVKSQAKPNFIFLAAITAGYAFWIKPTGMLLLPVIIIMSLRLHSKKWLFSMLAILMFFLIASPFLYQRYLYFGSPFYYNENSKYFVDEHNQLWGKSYPDVSFWQYLKTHSLSDYFSRFLVYGLASLVFSFISISIPFGIFAVWEILRQFRRYIPLILPIAVWLTAFTPIYSIYASPHYLFSFIPLAAILAASSLSNLQVNKQTGAHLLTIITVGVTMAFLIAGFIYPQYYFTKKKPGASLEFSRYVAKNIRGKIATSIGAEQIMAQLSDTTIAQKGLFNMSAPRSGIEIIYPGYFTDINLLTKWLKNNKVNYIIIDGDYGPEIPKHLKIYTGKEIPNNWQLIRSDFDSTSPWKMDLYKIN